MGVLLVWESQHDGFRRRWERGVSFYRSFRIIYPQISTHTNGGLLARIGGIIVKLGGEQNTVTFSSVEQRILLTMKIFATKAALRRDKKLLTDDQCEFASIWEMRLLEPLLQHRGNRGRLREQGSRTLLLVFCQVQISLPSSRHSCLLSSEEVLPNTLACLEVDRPSSRPVSD